VSVSAARPLARPEQPEPFVRGCAWPAGGDVPYPRADPADFGRLPGDTWAAATVPASVRLSFVGDAEAVEIRYRTATDDLGYRGAGAGTTFALWRGERFVDEQGAVLGEGLVQLRAFGVDAAEGEGDGDPSVPAVVYLPEGMKPLVTAIAGVGGSIEPAPRGPRWVAYGDSIAEGWVASGPAHAWPAVVARTHGLDVVNLGYAGSARGETVSAEHVASLPAEVISISHGTNCWTRIPHSAAQVRANTHAFLDIVRQGHPSTPIVVVSPVVRPDAEATANRLGATLADLRGVIEDVVTARIDGGDTHLSLVPGLPLIDASDLADGVHPGDAGHARLAIAIAAVLTAAVRPTADVGRS